MAEDTIDIWNRQDRLALIAHAQGRPFTDDEMQRLFPDFEFEGNWLRVNGVER